MASNGGILALNIKTATQITRGKVLTNSRKLFGNLKQTHSMEGSYLAHGTLQTSIRWHYRLATCLPSSTCRTLMHLGEKPFWVCPLLAEMGRQPTDKRQGRKAIYLAPCTNGLAIWASVFHSILPHMPCGRTCWLTLAIWYRES